MDHFKEDGYIVVEGDGKRKRLRRARGVVI